RAKNLRACARAVLERHQGVFPSDKESILDLPGVGPYTAGAIMSIALDQPEPLVDGNVERVLTRVFAVEEDLGRAEGKKKIWSLADELVPQKRPGCFNQALMELGATICKSSPPLCSECVLISDCLAHRQGRTRDFPVKSRSRKRSKVKELLLAMESDGKWLVVDSNEEGIYSGLWQFPWVWIHPASKDKIGLERLCRQFGVSNADLAPVWETRHAVTYRDINTLCFVLRMPSDFSLTLQEPPIHRWLELKTLESSPLPAYQKNFLRFLRGESP
ncbi:MAG: hypothetical protein KC964_01430, partial [Candidatus Omnitrophica bacterium]|nr:hypothetical protein [Candidatus Omnitrophota bacterium]